MSVEFCCSVMLKCAVFCLSHRYFFSVSLETSFHVSKLEKTSAPIADMVCGRPSRPSVQSAPETQVDALDRRPPVSKLDA